MTSREVSKPLCHLLVQRKKTNKIHTNNNQCLQHFFGELKWCDVLPTWPNSVLSIHSLCCRLPRKSVWIISTLHWSKQAKSYVNLYKCFSISNSGRIHPFFLFSFVTQLWVFSRNSWLLTRQLARAIILHADSGWYISICTACCLPVLNYGVWGGDSNRQGSVGSGLLFWLGKHLSLLCFESSWLYGTPTNLFTLEAFPHEEHLTQGSPPSTRCRSDYLQVPWCYRHTQISDLFLPFGFFSP